MGRLQQLLLLLVLALRIGYKPLWESRGVDCKLRRDGWYNRNSFLSSLASLYSSTKGTALGFEDEQQ